LAVTHDIITAQLNPTAAGDLLMMLERQVIAREVEPLLSTTKDKSATTDAWQEWFLDFQSLASAAGLGRTSHGLG
jgi:hypothetical protein